MLQKLEYPFGKFPLLANFLSSLFRKTSYSPFFRLDLLLIGSIEFLEMLGNHESDSLCPGYIGSPFLTHESGKVDDMFQHNVVPRLDGGRFGLFARRIRTRLAREPAFSLGNRDSISDGSLMQSFCFSLFEGCVFVVFELDERVEIVIQRTELLFEGKVESMSD